MIEVLLAVVILAVGLLAGSRMQILGLNYTQSAMTRSYANMAANDMLDRMRLNPEGQATYIGFNTDTSGIPADQGCATSGCNAAGRANQDLRAWASFFRKGDGIGSSTLLPPNAVGTITQVNGSIIVTIHWDDFIRGAEEERTITVGAAITGPTI